MTALPQFSLPVAWQAIKTFLTAFGLETLRDLPDPEQLEDTGLSGSQLLAASGALSQPP